MKKTLIFVFIVLGALILVLSVNHILENRPAKPADGPPSESFTPSEGTPLVHTDQLDRNTYPVGSLVGDWLASCDASDRDSLGAYILAHTAMAGETTTYTYMIYYRHESGGLSATPSVHTGDSGSRRLDVTYALGSGRDDYALTYVSVTLPAGEEPRVRLLDETGDAIGALMTATDTAIPQP